MTHDWPDWMRPPQFAGKARRKTTHHPVYFERINRVVLYTDGRDVFGYLQPEEFAAEFDVIEELQEHAR